MNLLSIFRKKPLPPFVEPVEPIIPGQRWQFTPEDKSPWPTQSGAVVTILDVREGWVRYHMGWIFPDNRHREEIFRSMYRLTERRSGDQT